MVTQGRAPRRDSMIWSKIHGAWNWTFRSPSKRSPYSPFAERDSSPPPPRVTVRTASSFPSFLLLFPCFIFSRIHAYPSIPFVKIRDRGIRRDETIITDNETANVLSLTKKSIVYSLESSRPARETGLATSGRKIRKGSQNPRFSQNILLHIFIIF